MLIFIDYLQHFLRLTLTVQGHQSALILYDFMKSPAKVIVHVEVKIYEMAQKNIVFYLFFQAIFR